MVIFSIKEDTRMNKYTSNESSFTMEKLLEAVKRIEMPLVDFPPLNRYIAEGHKMTGTLTMVTSQDGFEDIKEINTIHGILKIQYTRYVEYDKVYFMSPPKLDDYWKPDFSKL
jgi:hypothetical protein